MSTWEMVGYGYLLLSVGASIGYVLGAFMASGK
ncbi:hypothetical protein OCOJLMKI_0586 [Methylobacterium iners]|uniref:Uncharacterized protein n=1 Tax=Methylobacterium iners TaxID=418707 RepID=A0ABQ4RTS9_9HYPH|nr:hypothetical protein OCOJLMKI_0586 [Methylobacterium iners]